MVENDWSVVVIKCRADETRDLLIDFYDFMKDVVGVKNLLFLIRDRVEDDVVLSFQILIEPTHLRAIKSKIAYKLKGLIHEDNFLIEPDKKHPLNQHLTSSILNRKPELDSKKLDTFHDLLGKLSKLVVDMAKEDCFDSEDRVEIVHAMSLMLGCTEYGLLSTKEMEVGYYDRINDKYYTRLKEPFV